ncbi:MAG: inverse autotransporter beta domain-containing protein, partial [Gammaproteobacteria bacterium]
GGFLYSEHLQNGAPGAGTFWARSGDFDVAESSSVAGRVKAAAADELRDIPARDWFLDYLLSDGDIAAAARTRAAAGGFRLAETALRAAGEEAKEGGWLRTFDIGWQSELGGRFAHADINFLGSLRETADSAVAWQLRGYAGARQGGDRNHGGSAGLIWRRALTREAFESLVGVNAFADYGGRDDFYAWRWSLGGEYRSPWADLFANYYAPSSRADVIEAVAANAQTGRRARDGFATYSPGGYDAAIHLHSPEFPWLTAKAGYYFYDGDFGRADEDGLRLGLRFSPREFPLVAEVEYENGDEGDAFGGRISYRGILGETNGESGGASPEFRPREYFFAFAERDVQRVYRNTLSPPSPAGAGNNPPNTGLLPGLPPGVGMQPPSRAPLCTRSDLLDLESRGECVAVYGNIFNPLYLTPAEGMSIGTLTVSIFITENGLVGTPDCIEDLTGSREAGILIWGYPDGTSQECIDDLTDFGGASMVSDDGVWYLGIDLIEFFNRVDDNVYYVDDFVALDLAGEFGGANLGAEFFLCFADPTAGCFENGAIP